MIYPFWPVLFMRPDFLLWLLIAMLVAIAALVAYVWGLLDIVIAALIMTAVSFTMLWRWGRYVLVLLTIDYDVNNGEGRVTIERLIPAPNLPESVQMPLQDAAEGASEVNTLGIINTLITLLKPLRFLRVLSVGDLTFRAKGSDFRMTMYGLQDPEGVRKRIQDGWKAIAKIKDKQKAAKERQEQIDRMTLAVAAGVKQAFTEMRSDVAANAPTVPSLPVPGLAAAPTAAAPLSAPAPAAEAPAPTAAEPPAPTAEAAPPPSPDTPPPATL